MNSNFQLLSVTEKLISYLEVRILPNFPKKEKVFKDHVIHNNFTLMENIFAYNVETNQRIRSKSLKDILIRLSMLDYYVRLAYQKKYVSKHQFEVLGRYIIELRKIVYGVIRKENVQSSESA